MLVKLKVFLSSWYYLVSSFSRDGISDIGFERRRWLPAALQGELYHVLHSDGEGQVLHDSGDPGSRRRR